VSNIYKRKWGTGKHRNGGVVESGILKVGTMEKWECGKVGKWGSGEVGKWEWGEMGMEGKVGI